jgi:hypothetical protein
MAKTKSILEELNQISKDRDRNHVVRNRAEHVIQGAINLLEQIDKYYDADIAKDLQNRLVNSIRGRDSSKFERGIRKVIKESGTDSHESL